MFDKWSGITFQNMIFWYQMHQVLKVEEMEELFKGRPEHRPCTLENDTSDLEVTIHVDGIDEAE